MSAFLRHLLDWLTFFSIRLYGIHACKLADVKQGTYGFREHTNRSLERVSDVDMLLEVAKELLKSANERRAVATEKAKNLLTIASFSFAITGALLPKSQEIRSLGMKIAFFVALILLLNTVVLVLIYFGVGKEYAISLDQPDVELDAINFKKSLVNDYLRAQVTADNRTDYLLDIYKVARSGFLLAFFIIVALFAVGYFSR